MRFQRLIGTILAASSVFLFVTAATVVREDSVEPEIAATAEFPESNAFGLVVNGERNTLTVTIENKSDKTVTLVSIAGSLHQKETNALVKNLTTIKLGVPLTSNVPVRFPYAFHSEFKPGDLRLHIWSEHSADDKNFRVTAYDSVVQIVEPEMSIFDFKMISTYLVVIAIIGGVSYYTFLALFPQTKKPRSKVAAQPSTPASAVATGAGGYEEEWIPEHHLKKTKAGKKQSAAVSGTSGDDLSGAEANNTEGKRKKGSRK